MNVQPGLTFASHAGPVPAGASRGRRPSPGRRRLRRPGRSSATRARSGAASPARSGRRGTRARRRSSGTGCRSSARQPRRRGSVWFASGLAPPPATVPFATPTLPVRDQEPRRRRLAGFAKIVPFPPPGAFVPTPVWYHVYANTGAGDPINYQTPVATIEGDDVDLLSPLVCRRLEIRRPGVLLPGTASRKQNLDCAVEIILDSSGNDITNRPAPPTGLRAIAVKGGNIKVEWSYPNPATAAKTPTGFHVYDGIGSVSYTTPVATVSYASSIANVWTAVITGLSDGTTYSFGVRAFNAVAEEPNTATVTCTSDASGPGAVQGLMGVAVREVLLTLRVMSRPHAEREDYFNGRLTSRRETNGSHEIVFILHLGLRLGNRVGNDQPDQLLDGLRPGALCLDRPGRSASTAATFTPQWSPDGTTYYSGQTYTAPLTAVTTNWTIAVPVTAEDVQIVYTAQSGGTSSTLTAQLGQVTGV